MKSIALIILVNLFLTSSLAFSLADFPIDSDTNLVVEHVGCAFGDLNPKFHVKVDNVGTFL